MVKKAEQQLEAEAKQLEKRLEEIKKAGDEDLGETRDLENTPEDDAEEAETGGRLNALRDSLSQRLHQIKMALHKLRDKTYGICDRCGKEILAERLKAVPEANYCIDCAEKLENHEQ